MFNITQAVLDGTEKTLVSFDANTEGTIHSATLDNSSGSDITVTFEIGSVTWSYVATSNSKTSISERINIPADTIVTVSGASGVTVTCSYIEQAIDSNAALNQAQEVIATLPDGAINDTTPSDTNTYSSNKIDADLATKQPILQSSYTQIADASVSTGTHALDYSAGDYQKITATGDFTFGVSNFVTGKVCTFLIELVNGGDYAITFPSTWQFDSATAPALTSGGTDTLMLVKDKNEVFTLYVLGQAVGAVA